MKNLKLFLLSTLLALAHSAMLQAQNLVPNPSFEDTLGCPQGVPDLDGTCKFWESWRGTPDYFNNCSNNEGFYNSWGYQVAHTGQAYIGLLSYQITSPNWREQIGIKLTQPLTIGKKYYLSFFVSCAFNYIYTNIASNKIGALVTTYQFSDPLSETILPNASTFKSDSIITDTLTWVKIFGSFVADSSYQYLIIGNFYDDGNIDTINLPYQAVPQASIYYIDDICLSIDSIYSQTWTTNKDVKKNITKISFFPNPASNYINIKSESAIEFVQIINSYGEVVIISEKIFDSELALPISYLKSGIYYLKVKTTTGFYNSKINIIN